MAAVAAALATVPTLTPPAAAEDPPTELLGGDGPPRPLPNAALIEMTEWGYRYVAGQQDTDLTITFENGTLRYVDTGTEELRSLPKACARVQVATGIAATCPIPEAFADGMYLQVWPRLGDDVVQGSTLPAQFRMWVLGDAGDDVMRGGAGDDFFNGAQDRDTAYGGAGNDWLRTGKAADRIWGGSGNDRLVGVDGRDRVHGDEGDDRVEGGPGRDRLWGGPGRDVVSCAGGVDVGYTDAGDRVRLCETRLADAAPAG
jgi:hypothetical protein